MSFHNITGSLVFARQEDRAIYGVVTAYRRTFGQWLRAVVPSLIGAMLFIGIALWIIALTI